VNSATMIGTVLKDPELKYSQNKRAFMHITLSVHNKQGENRSLLPQNRREGQTNQPSQPVYVRILTFGERAIKHSGLKKGDSLMVEGAIKVHTWTAKDGFTGKCLEINPRTLIKIVPEPQQTEAEHERDR